MFLTVLKRFSSTAKLASIKPKSTETKSFKVHIPTRPAIKNEKKISGLEDYSEPFSLVQLVDALGWKDDPRTTVLYKMVDSLALNPSYSMLQKKEFIENAIKMMKGEDIKLELPSFEGTQQEKSFKRLHSK